MARQYKTGLIITGDASGGIRAIRSTEQELGQLNRGFDQGSRRSKRFAQDVGGTSRELQLLRRVAAPVGAVIAGMFAGQALQNQIRFGDELNKLNLRIGAGAEALSEYRYVAEQAGVQFGTLATAWQRQTRRIAQATTQGTGEAVKALEALNLSARELSQLRPEDQFERIAGALQGVANEGHRTALAMALWDTEGVALLQVVNQGTAAMQQQREEARRLGLTISDETAQAMADYSSELTRLQAVGTGVSRQLLAELVPAMTTTLQATSEWIDEMGGAAAILDTTKDAATGVAVVIAGRYTGALATATAAKLAATRQAVLYQAALARMAGVSTTAAASQIALAGATRGAAGAMALLGGPVGAAVVAGAAIYYFREELGLVRQPIEAATSEVDALTNAINMNSEAALKNGIAELTQELADLEQAAESATSEVQTLLMQGPGPGQSGVSVTGRRPSLAGARVVEDEADQKVANYTAAIARLEAQLESLGKSSVTPVRNIAATSEASKEAKKAAEQQANALEALRREMNPGRAEAAKFAEQTATLTKALASGEMGAIEHAQAIAHVAQQYLRAATGADELEKQQKSLVQQYDRHHLKAQQLRNDLSSVNQMYRDGVIDGKQYQRMIANIRDEMNQLALDADPAAQDMARAWEEASNRIDETFADAFRGAFDSFEDFSDQLLDGFKRLLAELAYQAFLRPIVVSFTGQMGGALGIQSMGGSTAGGISQVGGNLISTGQSVKKGYDWIMGGGGTGGWGQTFGNAASYFTGSGAGVGASALGMQGGISGTAITSANQIAGANTGTIWGNNWASGQGAGLVNAGVGMAAGYAGNWLSGSVFGESEEQNIGSTIGGAIGTIWGPIGTAIGSFLGGALGSAFAHSPTEPRTQFVTRASDGDLASLSQDELRARDWYYGGHVSQGAFGDVGVTHSGSTRVHRAFDMGAGHEASQWAQDLADAAVEMDGFIASLARSDEEVSAMAAAVQELSVRSGKVENVIDHVLVERPLAALDAAGLEISDRFRHMGVEDFAAELAILLGVTEQLKFTTDRLNIEFDLTADNVLVVAERMSMLAGGLDNLAAIQQGYYQVAFSEAERLGHQASDLQASLSAITDEVPTTVEALRALVEAQSLSSNEGQELALQLMQLAPALAQTRQAVEQVVTDAYQAELGRVPDTGGLTYWVDAVVSGAASLEDALWGIAQAAQGSASQLQMQLHSTGAMDSITSALAAYHGALATANDIAETRQQQLRDEQRAAQDSARAYQQQAQQARQAAQQMGQLLDSLMLSDQSILAPAARLEEAQRQFAALQVRAESGDSSAAQEMSGAASNYLEAAEAYFGQGTSQYAEIFTDVTGSVADLRDEFVSAESSILASLRSAEQTAERLARQQVSVQQRNSGQHLEAQEAAQRTLIDQLTAQVDTLDGIHWISQLLDLLPAGIARELSGIIASDTGRGQVLPDGEYVDDSAMTALERSINDIYRDALGRNADVDGLAYWVEQLVNGAELDDVRHSLRQDRPDAGGGGGAMTALEQQISDLYREVLGRDADADGLAYWADRHASGMSLDAIRWYMRVDSGDVSSLERQINDLYRDVFGRYSDASGLEYWAQQAASGLSLSDIRWNMEQDRLDGSHADGLRHVPFDGYRAELHRGELVATAGEAPAVRALLDGQLPMLAPLSLPVGGPGHGNGELVAELRKANQRLEKMEAELAALRAERNGSAARAERQRDDQLDELERSNRRHSHRRTGRRETV